MRTPGSSTSSSQNIMMLVTRFHPFCAVVAFATLAFIATSPLRAQFPAPCDADKSCIARAYTSFTGTGQDVDYVRIDNRGIIGQFSNALTVEMWMNPKQQAGNVYIASLWGTDRDFDDVWKFYINTSGELVFEVNATATNNGDADNIRARSNIAAYYDRWVHVAGVYDGSTRQVQLYINGGLVATGANAPTALRSQRTQSNVFIGASASFVNESGSRAFVGQLDEIRIWKRALGWQELYCNSNKSLAGNESGLVLYYRCNEAERNGLDLCDATGNGYAGKTRNKVICSPSTRTLQSKHIISVNGVATRAITEDIKCDSTKTWAITVQDTSVCGSTVGLSVAGTNSTAFRIAPTSLTLTAGQTLPATLTYFGILTGPIVSQLRLTNANRCTVNDTVRFNLNRYTDIRYNRLSMRFDTIFAGCTTTPYIDSVIRICNNTLATGTNRNVTITRGQFRTAAFELLPPANRPFPVILTPNECLDFTIRFKQVVDTTFAFNDTLFVISDDACKGSGIIPISGVVQQVFDIRQTDGRTTIKRFSFPATCPNDISDPRSWNWYNLTRRNVLIDSIKFGSTLVPVGQPRTPPTFTLPPSAQVGQPIKYYRFRPSRPGVVNDTIVYYFRLLDRDNRTPLPCSYVHKVAYTGTGRDNDVEFSTQNVDFGNVIVGKDSTIKVTFINRSTTDVMNISFYMKKGDVFIFPGAKSASLAPGQSTTIDLTFRPVDSITYIDELCLFEQRCFTTQCIPVRGKGIIERFSFSPLYMRTENVVGCSSREDSIEIVNVSSTDQTLRNFSITGDPNGTFTPVDPPSLAGFTTTIPRGQRRKFKFLFTPKNNTTDIVTKAYLNYTPNSGDPWKVQLLGTSITPKVYITPLVTFRTIEAGDTKTDTLYIENASLMDIKVDSLFIPPGFRLIRYERAGLRDTVPMTLKPRDSVIAIVVFEPTTTQKYDNDAIIYSNTPCVNVSSKSRLTGGGKIVKLDAPVSLHNFSQVRPCDCKTEIFPLQNNSVVHEMFIDSMWFAGTPIQTGLYRYTSPYLTKNAGVFPYPVPPLTSDTLAITFCPRSTAVAANITSNVLFRMKASGKGGFWRDSFNIQLIGKRALTFRPDSVNFFFPNTLVDAFATWRQIRQEISLVQIPTIDLNEFQEPVQIDSITFEPSENVFFATNRAGGALNFPILLAPGGRADTIRFRFKPRAKRVYTARAKIHYSKPCVDSDTTIYLQGSGIADFNYTIALNFDSTGQSPRVFKTIPCDTVRIPVYSTRKMPETSVSGGSVIDIRYRLQFDTTKLLYTGATSQFSTPVITPRAVNGREISIKGCRDIDSLDEIMVLSFVPIGTQRDTIQITLDSLRFDSPEVLRYNMDDFAAGDRATIIVAELGMAAQKGIVNFDSVRVLDCAQRTFTMYNTGDTTITVDSLLVQHKALTYISSVPPRTTLIPPGDSSIVTVEYCPRDFSSFDTLAYMASTFPCPLLLKDSVRLQGKGYAPVYPVQFGTDAGNFSAPPDISAGIGDTVAIPIYLDKDLNTVYRSTTYWLEPVSFAMSVRWNPFMFKFLDATSVFGTSMTATPSGFSMLNLDFSKLMQVRAGKIAELRFAVLVPDTVEDKFEIIPPQIFTTDSLLFLDVRASAPTTKCLIGGECNTTTWKYIGTRPQLYQTQPNPAGNTATFRFDIQETVPVSLVVYSASGEVVKEIENGSRVYRGGQHSIDADLSSLSSGCYTYVLRAGVFSAVKQLVVVK
ncbi:MAG: choice-of-anchor D domain-containing protein [Candidatus Kapabacteria bacterium]|nr:choice-of-anchor D domain-containing protein [Candidatus Kapabacteria bacterium]